MSWQIIGLLVMGGLYRIAVPTPILWADDLPAGTVSDRADAAGLEQTQRAADARAFREAFEKDAALDVRTRLERAAAVTAELAAMAQRAAPDDLARAGFLSTSRASVYPRASHLPRLIAARPWIRDYLQGDDAVHLLQRDTFDLRWPTDQDAPQLRQLVHDKDPDLQALAIEALSTLHDPADVLLIGGLLRTDVPAVGVLLPQSRSLAVAALGLPRRAVRDRLCVELYWHSGSVAGYAHRAVQHMTGVELTAQSFDAWVQKHRADRNSLWYWQQRLQRQFDRLDLSLARLAERDQSKWFDEIQRQRGQLRDSIRRELAALDPQVEARVLLLANHRHAGGADVTNPDQRFFDPPWQTRLGRDDLWRLLEGARPWDDVDWADWLGGTGEVYDRVVTRILLGADRNFTRDDVPRLQALVDRPPQPLMWSGRAAVRIGISRLLPAAEPANLDDPRTRDGYLRNVVREERDVFVRGYTARELVRIGLPANGPFLRETFFSEGEAEGVPDLRGSILEELGQPPLTPHKRTLLVDLVSDKRCRPLLTRQSRRMGDDVYRQWAAGAINAHAQRELVTRTDLQDLRDPGRSSEVLDQILTRLKDLGRP